MAGEPEARRVAVSPRRAKKRLPRVSTSQPRTRKAAARTGAAQPPTVDAAETSAARETVREMPDLDLLDREESDGRGGFSDQNIEDMSRLLENQAGRASASRRRSNRCSRVRW